MDAIRETGELSDDTVTALKDAMEEFRRGFETGSGDMLVVDEDPVDAVDEIDVGQETVARRVPPAKQKK